MVSTCGKQTHLKRTFEELVEQKVKEVLSKTNDGTAEAVREAGLDKFYTIPAISEKCLASIGSHYKWSDWGTECRKWKFPYKNSN